MNSLYESMAEFVVGFVKDRVASLFTNEVTSLFTNIHQEVEDIKQELVIIQSLLHEADKRRDHTEEDVNNNGFRSWLQELREVAFEAEDVVTEYTHYTTQQHMQTEPRGFREFICEKGAAIVSSLKGRRGLASQVHEIKKRLIGIHQRSERYGFLASLQQGSTSTTSSNVLRRAFPNADEDQVVGIESARDDLIARFDNGSSDLTTISVVGEGGSGKTTLARQVYDRVHQGFQYHAWVVVPEAYDRVELLRKLARALFKSSIPEGLDRMDDQTLTRKMRGFLRGKRYFVVFDDVWKEDFWSDIESVLINCNNGGRVMITTRKMKVADFCQRSPSFHTHKMKPLPFPKAWELFCKKVFRSDGCCPTELESLGIQIVKRCGGLPLAILALAGLLSTKVKTVKDWKTFHASLTDELNSDPELKNAIKILSLSYNELPFNLKQCFLYFGMFRKYSDIRNGRLIRQWIAEGFVKEQDDKTAEDVAQDSMDELISRNLVEVSFFKVTGKCSSCRVHDLFHEIILKKSKDTSFSQVKSGSVELISFQRIARRISFVNASNNVLKGIIAPRSHSVVVFSESVSINDVVPIFVTNFKFLKVLDFEDNLGLNCLPEDIGNLFDLRYLSVRRTNVKMLPKSIEKLQNLETFDLRQSMVIEMPIGVISKLLRLRNLYAGIYCRWFGIKLMGGIGSLKALQKLYMVDVGDDGTDLFTELRNLTQLKTLRITNARSEDNSALCGSLEKLKNLRSLLVRLKNENEIIDLESMSSPPQHLDRIELNGVLRKLPKWINQLENLVKVRLANSKLKDDDFHVVKNMKNLLELGMFHDAYVGEHLQFEAGVLPKLKNLSLMNLSELRSLTIHETALPMLKFLSIGRCPLMNEVPSGLQHLTNLNEVRFIDMPTEFGSLDFQSVAHVNTVIFESIARYGLDRRIYTREYLNSNLMEIVERYRGRNTLKRKWTNENDQEGLEHESGFYFNMKYFEDQVQAGEWDEVERYLCGFTELEDNRYSMKIFFEIRKQKYLEALDRQDRARAAEILEKDLKVFSSINEQEVLEITKLLTLDNFRQSEKFSNYGDTMSSRNIMLVELKKLIEANPLLHDKLTGFKSSRPRTS